MYFSGPTQVTATRRRLIRVLHIPAQLAHPCALLLLPDRSADFAHAIGAACMDETALEVGGSACCLYLDSYRATLAANTRLVALAGASDGHEHETTDLRGDGLLSGLTSTGDDIDVPEEAVRLARSLGLVREPARGGPAGGAAVFGELPSP